jgi:hypothetical protein
MCFTKQRLTRGKERGASLTQRARCLLGRYRPNHGLRHESWARGHKGGDGQNGALSRAAVGSHVRTFSAVSALANSELAVGTLRNEAGHKAAPTSWVSDPARRSWLGPVWIRDFKVSAGSCITINEGGLGV